MRINADGIALIRKFEGCELRAYRCSAGKWSVGFGHTGPGIVEGLVISPKQAEEFLVADLRRFETGVWGALTPARQATINPNQFSSLVCFAFNCGLAAFKASTLLRYVNEGRPNKEIGTEFLRWSFVRDPKTGDMKLLPGLQKRRKAEANLFTTEPEVYGPTRNATS